MRGFALCVVAVTGGRPSVTTPLPTVTFRFSSPPASDDIGGVVVLDPGQVNLRRVVLTPGDYLLSCIVLGAVDHRPHFMHGMERVIHVS